jgi:hypothetical protein
MAEEEIKTEQLRVGPGLFVKVLREFGFPTIVALAIASAFAWYVKTESVSRTTFEQKMSNDMKKLRILIKTQKGCPIDDSDVD